MQGSNWVEFAAPGRITRIDLQGTIGVGGGVSPGVATDTVVNIFASLSRDIPGGPVGFSTIDQNDILHLLMIGFPTVPVMILDGDTLYGGGTRDGRATIELPEPVYVRFGEKLYLHACHATAGVVVNTTAIMSVYTLEN